MTSPDAKKKIDSRKPAKAKVQRSASSTKLHIGARVMSLRIEPASSTATVTRDEAKGDTQSLTDRFPSVSSAADAFQIGMLSLFRYWQGTGALINETTASNKAEFLKLILDAARSGPGSGDEPLAQLEAEVEFRGERTRATLRKTMRVLITDPEVLVSLNEFNERAFAATSILCNSMIQQITGCFERLLGDILAAHYALRPASIPLDQQMTNAELLEAKSLSDVHAAMIAKQLQRLAAESNEKQIELVQRFLGCKLSEHISDLGHYTEVFLRRHVVVHAFGIASQEYVHRVAALPNGPAKVPKVGEDLTPTPRYVHDAWGKIYALGTLVAELAMKKAGKTEDESEDAEEFLNAAGFEALKLNHLEGAFPIFAYAKENRIHSGYAHMAELNYAICAKGTGFTGWQKLVSQKKWEAAGVKFAVGAAALREDIEHLRALLPALRHAEPDFDPADLLAWPIFRWVKKKPEYLECVRAAWGRVPSDIPVRERFHVLARPGKRMPTLKLGLTNEELAILASMPSRKTEQAGGPET